MEGIGVKRVQHFVSKVEGGFQQYSYFTVFHQFREHPVSDCPSFTNYLYNSSNNNSKFTTISGRQEGLYTF